MARYAKSREETLRNSGMLESPLTEAEQRELALVRDECRFPARTPAIPVRRPFSAVDPGSEGESAAKRPCAPSYALGLPGEPRLAPGRRLDMGPSVLPPSETDPPSDTSPPSVTAPPPAAPFAGRAASAIAPSGATDATSFGPDDPVAPAGDGTAPRMPVAPSYAVMVAAPTVHAQPSRAPEAPKKPAYPPIVIECLPNYVHHLGRIRQILGRPANTRAYGKGYRISPESADEYRVIQRYLSDLKKEDPRVSWFSYSIPAEKDLKVAVRGIPVTTDPEELAQALRGPRV
ncbi:translation initiation factor IF-2-like [Pieris brassicae]|uniref:translation initiation factor IF-2-like n=1 Tax=Pieris brassicae TaxID=7116 RepID=UPI001E66138D|nr:translation initiation factor IF-2-like [Pieris brassicae]